MNNAVSGITLENLRKRINLKLTSNEDIYTKHASRASFISDKMFNENLFAINRIKEELVLNRPIYVGMAILDLSKVLMYDFQNKYMLKKKKKKKKKECLQTQTVFVMKLKLMMFIKIYFKIKSHMIIVITPKTVSFFFFVDENKQVIGKTKDEAAGMPIKEYTELRSKMYSYNTDHKSLSK